MPRKRIVKEKEPLETLNHRFIPEEVALPVTGADNPLVDKAVGEYEAEWAEAGKYADEHTAEDARMMEEEWKGENKISYSDITTFSRSGRPSRSLRRASPEMREGSLHTTVELIIQECEYISRKDAREIEQLMRKHDPYSILHLVRRLKEYRQRVRDLEARLKVNTQEEVEG